MKPDAGVLLKADPGTGLDFRHSSHCRPNALIGLMTQPWLHIGNNENGWCRELLPRVVNTQLVEESLWNRHVAEDEATDNHAYLWALCLFFPDTRRQGKRIHLKGQTDM